MHFAWRGRVNVGTSTVEALARSGDLDGLLGLAGHAAVSSAIRNCKELPATARVEVRPVRVATQFAQPGPAPLTRPVVDEHAVSAVIPRPD